MTHVEPFHDFRHGNATFRYQRHETGIQVWILGAHNELLAGFPLTYQQVIDLFHELDFCEECGGVLAPGEWPKHGPGRCSNPDDPGGDLD